MPWKDRKVLVGDDRGVAERAGGDIAYVVLTVFFFFNETATTEIYTAQYTLSLHDALPISARRGSDGPAGERAVPAPARQPRATHPAASRRLGAPRVPALPRPARRDARRGEPTHEPVHPVRDVRRPSVPGLRQVRRAGGV